MASYNGHSKWSRKNVSVGWGKLRHGSWGYLNVFRRASDFSAVRKPIFLKFCKYVLQAILHTGFSGFFLIRKITRENSKLNFFAKKSLNLTSIQF